ncbi:MAG: ABC transporter ATP-binding protein [Victivallales bacterium]|nr:ABC transporter ATP-binding protein [Victivallales bacterium]
MNENETILEVQGLQVGFRKGNAVDLAVRGTGFTIHRGEMLALVGESGSGKSVTAMSLLGLLPRATAVIAGGQARFHGQDLLRMDDSALNAVRGSRISMIFQEPMTALNPVLTISRQIEEVLERHTGLRGDAVRRRAVELLSEVGIPEPAARAKEYPHQLSGGMRQRVMIAIALACGPELLIADEPTTALDVTVQAQIMELMAKLRRERGTAVLLITHNLALVREQADTVAVMYAGRIVELAPASQLFTQPLHPYTRLLMQSIPSTEQRGRRLAAIAGQVPAPSEKLPGCRFAPRCPLASPECTQNVPELAEKAPRHWVACIRKEELASAVSQESVPEEAKSDMPLLEVRRLQVLFPVRRGIFARAREFVHAVDGLDLTLRSGETLALDGESVCGKTTVGKALIRLVQPTGGQILLDGQHDIASLPPHALRPFRRRIQMIFQDPFSSLDPRLMVGESICEGMDELAPKPPAEREGFLRELLEKVGLPEDAATRYPHQFSGGQRQRIGLARALAVQPSIIVCDECTSALDESVQAQILNLLKDIQRELGIAYLFITHDLSVVAFLADRIAVMYLGQIVEEGPTAQLLAHPAHPYTRALLAAAPRMDGDPKSAKIHLAGEVPSPIHPPSGCRFHPRCPHATPECATVAPPACLLSDGHTVRCHHA